MIYTGRIKYILKVYVLMVIYYTPDEIFCDTLTNSCDYCLDLPPHPPTVVPLRVCDDTP